MIMKENKKILVVGSANTDLVISADHFPLPGETMFGHGFMTNHGGKGANQAVAAARLGGDTAFVGKVGDDQFGNSTIDSGENNIVLDSGANACLTAADVREAEALFADASIVLMQLETPVEALVEAAALGKKAGAYVVLNPAPAPKKPLPEALLKNVDLLIPNETEASYIAGIEVKGEDDIPAAMDEIQKLGVKDVIITVGSKGVCARLDGELIRVPAFKVKAVDTTAAGDTFCGALCVALSQGKSLPDAILFGNKAASISVTRRGAQMSMPHLDEVEL